MPQPESFLYAGLGEGGELSVRLAERVSESAHAQQALRASEERFRKYFELGLIGMAITSPAKGMIEVNDELCRILGHERAEILRRSWAEMTHPDDLAADVANFDRVMAGEIDGYTMDKRWVRKDGSVVHSVMSAKCVRRADGSPDYFVKLVLDTTERQRAEVALRRSQAYLAEGERLSRTGSWAWNASTGELYWSDEHFRICGVDPATFTPSAEEFFNLVYPDDRSAVRASFQHAVNKRRDFEEHYRIVRPLGEVRHIHSLAHPVSSDSGELLEYIGTVIDTTEHRQAEVALKKAFDEIRVLKDRLAQEKSYLEEEIRTERGFEEIIGSGPALRRLLARVQTVAPTDSTVLILGETGTGKELVARAIHNLSERRDRTFVKLNCAAIPAALLESELFGHERGAFTSAVAQRIGRFELAHQGTIFLDEVGEIPLELQAKLLRVLQERDLERVGGTRTVHVNVRVIAATNRNLRQMVIAGGFRSDLFYRLNVFPLEVPPLRDRLEDIPDLVRHFAKRYAAQMKKTITHIPAESMRALCDHCWPGNIREVENLVERSVILSRGTTLEVPLTELRASAPGASAAPLGGTLEEAEREHIRRALDECNWVIGGPSGAAIRLGMKRTSLQYRMQRLGIARPVGASARPPSA